MIGIVVVDFRNCILEMIFLFIYKDLKLSMDYFYNHYINTFFLTSTLFIYLLFLFLFFLGESSPICEFLVGQTRGAFLQFHAELEPSESKTHFTKQNLTQIKKKKNLQVREKPLSSFS